MITIVFVDEQPEMLEHVRDAMEPWRDVWDVRIACGAAAALTLFDELEHVDVVVTEVDMADMDGAELLTIIRDLSPHTARIILSGRSEREALLRVVGPAHQYLSKPVDIDELAQVIEHVRGASIHELREPINSLIGQADRLPSPPKLFQELMVTLESDDWKVDGVAELLGSDVALTAEILKLVNSSFFGFFGEVSSVERAVSLLGVDLIRSVVLGSKLFLPDDDLATWLDLHRLDWRSKSVALGARALAVRDGASSDVGAAAYLAGMVSEVGMLVMARVPRVSAEVTLPLNFETMLEIERVVFGGDRFQVGAQLLRLWGFSSSIIDAISPLSTPTSPPTDGLGWYLAAARRLVLDDGFAPADLDTSPGASAEIDHALELMRSSTKTMESV